MNDAGVTLVGVLSGALAAVFVAVAGYVCARMLSRRARRLREEQEAEALDFESRMMSQFGEAPAPPPLNATPTPPDPSAPPTPSASSTTPAASPLASASTAKDVLRQLEAAGQVADIEGPATLSDGSPDGIVVRLRDGELGLILPRPEPPEAMDRYARGYGRVFTLTATGQVLVSRRLVDHLAERMDFGGL